MGCGTGETYFEKFEKAYGRVKHIDKCKELYVRVKFLIEYFPHHTRICSPKCYFYLENIKACSLFGCNKDEGVRDKECIEMFGEE